MSELTSVYVLTGGFDYDGDEVLGAYDSLDAAIAAMEKDLSAPDPWVRYSVYRCILDSNEPPSKSAWKRTER